MEKMKLDIGALEVESFEAFDEEIKHQFGARAYISELETCTCIDCRTATAGRCCPP